MKKTKTTTTAEAPSKWPKILVRDYVTGEGRERILSRLEAIDLLLKVQGQGRPKAVTCIDSLLAGHYSGMEPIRSLTHFSRFTFEDSVKAAALDLLIALKSVAINYETLLAATGDRNDGKSSQSLNRARIAIAKAERIEPEDVSFIRTEA